MGCCPDDRPLARSLRPGIRIWYNQHRKLGPKPWVVRIVTEYGQEATITVDSFISLEGVHTESMFDPQASPMAAIYFPRATYTQDPLKPGAIIILRVGAIP